MKTAFETLSLSKSANDVVVIKLWEVYLLYHPSNLYKTLSENSIDQGPEHDQNFPGRVIFRFTSSAWEAEVKPLLYEYRIPVTITSNPYTAVRMKGRIPALR
jgi:hypothetical protein